MTSATRKAAIGGMLLIPVFCCVLSVGAFLHVVVSSVEVAEASKAELLQQAAKITTDTEKTARELRELEKRIAELKALLAKEKSSVEAARQLHERIQEMQRKRDELAKQLAKLIDDTPRAREAAAKAKEEERMARDEVDAAKSQVDEVEDDIDLAKARTARAGDQLKDVQEAEKDEEWPEVSSEELARRLAELQKQLKEADAKWERLSAEESDLAIEREATKERTFQPKIASPATGEVPTNPMFVDCDREGIVIYPENSRMASHPTAADRTRFVAETSEAGYLLFLVRPDGFESFQRYRDIVESAVKNGESIAFGYEPINQELILVFSKTEN